MISTPTFVANAGIYLLEWQPEGISLRIDRLHNGNHATTGELLIRYKAPGNSEFEHLHQARLNLTSTRERSMLGKYLSERVSEVLWTAVLEQACVKTLEKHREGEPVRMVGNQDIPQINRHRLNPLVLEDQPNMIYGAGGVGKTTLAVTIALLVQSGEERLGLWPTQGNVLWLDYETSEAEINDVAKKLKEGLGLDPSLEFAYRFCSQSVADDIANIQAMVLETGAQLVVIDSVGAACGGEPESADVILRYFRALRSLRVTTLSLDHVNKENTRGPFGSVYKWNACRQIWEAIKGSVEAECISVGLHHRKRNTGPLLKPLGYQFSFDEGCITPEKVEARTVPEILATMALADQIEATLLRGTPMTPAELGVELGKTPNHISKTLSMKKNRFVSVGDGKWGVKTNEGVTTT